ncbi:unnamed protein product [Strongylus vulgaris]|uniref:Coenzyme PQQ synthesis protein F-like C-terminal lobe domain-containing protein n=1 Tax=Strongylus vulgaris TaxID=40348 RepID=A0A3P7JZH7_STRVU|nr:unnamed protein product [Strongylus vulgaris]
MDRIEAFIEKIRETIVQMPQEEFEQQTAGLITRLLEKPKTLGGRSRRFWSEIECRMYDFERYESEVAELRSVTKDELLQYFDRKFARSASQRRMIAVFVHGKDESKDGMIEKIRTKRDITSGETVLR